MWLITFWTHLVLRENTDKQWTKVNCRLIKLGQSYLSSLRKQGESSNNYWSMGDGGEKKEKTKQQLLFIFSTGQLFLTAVYLSHTFVNLFSRFFSLILLWYYILSMCGWEWNFFFFFISFWKLKQSKKIPRQQKHKPLSPQCNVKNFFLLLFISHCTIFIQQFFWEFT